MLLLLNLVHAAAFYTPTEGVRAMGRGGAYIAGNHDLSAQRYNPAALRNIEGGLVRADLALVSQSVTFTRDGYDPVENLGKPFPIPSLGLAYGMERATVAFGLWTPYAPAFEYAADGAQRFSMIDSVLFQTSVGPSASFDVTPWLTLGGSVAWMTNTVGRKVVLTTAGGDDPAGDIDFDMLVSDMFGIGGTLAVAVRPIEPLEIALSAQLPVKFNGTGYLEADFSKNGFYSSGVIVDPIARDDEVSLAIKMPLVLRGGAVYRPNERLEVELAGTWENWSNFEEIVLTDIQMTVDVDNTNPLFPEDPSITDDVTLPSAYQDSFSVRLGGEYRLNDRVDVRAGGMYESSGVPDNIMAVDLVDGPKFGGGVGATPHFGPVDVDVAFFALKVQDQTITNSDVSQIKVDVLSAEVSSGDTVGNGTFESLIWMPSIGLAYHFGQKG